MKDSGTLKKILGIEVERSKDGSMFLSQKHYTQRILDKFGMTNAKPHPIPLSPTLKLEDEKSPLLTTDEHSMFRKIIGRLMYLVIGTRLDLTYATSRLSQFLSAPRSVHLQAAKHVL